MACFYDILFCIGSQECIMENSWAAACNTHVSGSQSDMHHVGPKITRASPFLRTASQAQLQSVPPTGQGKLKGKDMSSGYQLQRRAGDGGRGPWAALQLSTGCPVCQEGHGCAQRLLPNGERQGAAFRRFPST